MQEKRKEEEKEDDDEEGQAFEVIRLFGKESQRHPATCRPEKTRQCLPEQPKSPGSCSRAGVGSKEGGGGLSALSHTRKGCCNSGGGGPTAVLLPLPQSSLGK